MSEPHFSAMLSTTALKELKGTVSVRITKSKEKQHSTLYT